MTEDKKYKHKYFTDPEIWHTREEAIEELKSFVAGIRRLEVVLETCYHLVLEKEEWTIWAESMKHFISEDSEIIYSENVKQAP